MVNFVVYYRSNLTGIVGAKFTTTLDDAIKFGDSWLDYLATTHGVIAGTYYIQSMDKGENIDEAAKGS